MLKLVLSLIAVLMFSGCTNEVTETNTTQNVPNKYNENFVKSHFVKGMSKSEVLAVFGKPEMEDFDDDGTIYLTYQAPFSTKDAHFEFCGYTIILKKDQAVKWNSIHRSVGTP